MTAIPTGQDNSVPLGAYNFHVAFSGGAFGEGDLGEANDATALIGGFSEISGLEASMEPRVIRSGGDNYRVHNRIGTVSFGTVMLKRGLVVSRHLWGWWSLFTGANHPATDAGPANGSWRPTNRYDVTIMLLQDRRAVVGWKLERALPVKFRIGDLNASAGELAIEELHLAHEGLHLLTDQSPPLRAQLDQGLPASTGMA